MMHSSAQEIAQLAIELCERARSAGETIDAVMVAQVADAADGSAAVVLEAYTLCARRAMTGDDVAEAATQLLDDVQASSLVR